MSTQNRTTLKTYFETGDKPTQSQFADLIDSMALISEVQGGAVSGTAIPVDASITTQDTGKLAMLDYDGNIKLYAETPAVTGTKGKWLIQFNQLSATGVSFQYAERNNGNISAMSDNWLGTATTADEEAANFMAYINNSYGYMLTASAGANTNEVQLEQVQAKGLNQSPTFYSGNISVNTIENPQPDLPVMPKRICVGILKNVDESAHTAVLEDVVVLQAESAPDIVQSLSQAATKTGTEHAFTLAQLIAVPTAGGKVRAITQNEMQNEMFAFSCAQNALYFFIKPHTESNKYYCLKRGLS